MKRATIAFLCFAISTVAAAQQRLREGIIVDTPRDAAYVMTPDGGIAAVDLASGNVRWTSTAAAKPLALIGNRLVGQIEPKTAAQINSLQLTALDVQQRGAPIVRNAADLPNGVRANVAETLEGDFSAEAFPSGAANAIVAWTYVPASRRSGMPSIATEAESGQRESLGNANADASRTGAVRLNLNTGAISPTGLPEAAGENPTWVIEASEIDASPATQYESADGRHILTSERVADDPEWNKYRWVVTERATGQRVGELRNHISFAPFVVNDSVIVFETTPYVANGKEEPAKLRGVDLRTGREVWSVEVREVEYRGPMPP